MSQRSDQSPEDYHVLKLSSAEGPIYRHVKNQPARPPRPGEIPTIDISPLSSPHLADRRLVASQIHHAATTIGFFYITNHSITSPIINSATNSTLSFFHLPPSKKEPLNSQNFPDFIGYKPPSTQRINPLESLDNRENFSIKYSPEYDSSLPPHPQIPPEISQNFSKPGEGIPWEIINKDIPSFKSDILGYYNANLILARKLMQGFALSLSLPETYFDSKIQYPDAALALNYYPALPSSSSKEDEVVSIGSHTDFQFLTILHQDTIGGLQILTPSNEWISAPPIPNTLIINIGDYAKRITNDKYLSTVHRAKNQSVEGKERISLAFFFGFGLNERLEVIENCVGEGEEKRYMDVGCRDWIEKRIRESFV